MKKFISMLLILSVLFSLNVYASPLVELKDISGHWAEQEIQTLADKGVINGKGNGIFDPGGTLTVAEFVKLSVAVVGYTYDTSGYDYWATPYIDKAIELGMIWDNQFSTYTRPITREEMAYIGINAYGRLNTLGSSLMTSEVIKSINDYAKVSDQYKDGVLNSYLIGLIKGKPNNLFDPSGTATRAEAATVIIRMIDETKRQVFSFDDIPHVITTHEVWAPDKEVFDPDDPRSTDGYINKEIVLYAPLNSKGERVTEVLDLLNYGEAYGPSTIYRAGAGYLPTEEIVSVSTGLATKEEWYSLSINEKVKSQELSLVVYLDKFNDASNHPYSIVFFGVNSGTYMDDFKTKHGDLWDYIIKTLFGDGAELIDETFTNAVNTVGSSGDSITQFKSVNPTNGRMFVGSGSGSSISIYITDAVY